MDKAMGAEVPGSRSRDPRGAPQGQSQRGAGHPTRARQEARRETTVVAMARAMATTKRNAPAPMTRAMGRDNRARVPPWRSHGGTDASPWPGPWEGRPMAKAMGKAAFVKEGRETLSGAHRGQGDHPKTYGGQGPRA